METEKKVRVEIIKGVEGLAIYINDYRVAGSKPWGGGQSIKAWTTVREADILTALEQQVTAP